MWHWILPRICRHGYSQADAGSGPNHVPFLGPLHLGLGIELKPNFRLVHIQLCSRISFMVLIPPSLCPCPFHLTDTWCSSFTTFFFFGQYFLYNFCSTTNRSPFTPINGEYLHNPPKSFLCFFFLKRNKD